MTKTTGLIKYPTALTPAQLARLRALSAETRVPIARLLRDAVDAMLAASKHDKKVRS